jgi:hydroxymethylpyrimidine pyrophosphatase-like HAD family hydrolase
MVPLPEISLLITDIDGSLLNNNKEITAKAYQAVQQLRKAGIQLSLTSSRPPRGMQKYIDDLKITTPISGL